MPPQAQVPQGEISPYITASYIGQYSKKNEGLAAFYSIFPGAGLAYVGRYVFGLLVALGSIAVYVIDAIYFSKYSTVDVKQIEAQMGNVQGEMLKLAAMLIPQEKAES